MQTIAVANFLQKRYNAIVYASKIEASIIENSSIEPLCFFSGARPLKELENRFLKAKHPLGGNCFVVIAFSQKMC